MIIGYIYSQKCNENAKKKRLIYFELWKHFFFNILKKGYQNSKCNNPVQFGIFLTFLTQPVIKTTNPHSSQNRVSRDSLPTQSSNYDLDCCSDPMPYPDHTYITNYTCSPNSSEETVDRARVSFMSGHTSFSFYR